MAAPTQKPHCAHFSSGPCAKPNGWSSAWLSGAFVGRSHRSKPGKIHLKSAITRTRALLKLPDDYKLAIVPASDTGAFEMAMWSMLGARGVDVLDWESFGKGWQTDIVKHLKLDNVRSINADYGYLPDLSQVNFNHDVVFTANGTTSGVRIPNYDWIASDRAGLTLVDATSAVFAQPVDWDKVDVLTFSWQKVLGGEAAHGMLVVSPRAVERLESYTPPWPLPKLFRMTKGGKLIEGLFEGETINTPSMLCVSDYLTGLDWVDKVGGGDALMGRANRNAQVVWDWIERTAWVENLAVDPATRSNTSICLKIVDADVSALTPDQQNKFCKAMVQLLDEHDVAYDIGGYRDAPPGLRVWTGATVEEDDLVALLPWLEWAFETVKASTPT